MISNYTYVCVPCRYVTKYVQANVGCPECHGELVCKYRWSAPKKNNDRAWRRIEKGEWAWDRRKVRKRPPCGAYLKSSWIPRKKKGQHARYAPVTRNKYRQPIEVDLGG